MAQSPDERTTSLEDLQAAFARMLSDRDEMQPGAKLEHPLLDPQVPHAGHATHEPSEHDAQDTTPLAIVEAVLFVGHPQNEPVTPRMLAALMRGVFPSEVEQLVEQLNRIFEEDGRPYTVQSNGDGYRLVLREEFEPVRIQLLGGVRHARLNQPTVEVLAIVAYRQPISGESVDKLRGISSQNILRSLVRRQLLQVEREPNAPRRPIYRTTQRFLDLMNLDSLDQLPQGEDLERAIR